MFTDKPRAIVVDDDPHLNEIFAEALEIAGMQVERVSDSRKAMERITATLPDLVTVDMQMPHVTGKDLLTAIRRDPALDGIKVILITAAPHAARDEALDEMADVILIKPISLTQIMDMARRLLG